MPIAMPDVANQSCATTEGTLDWVGMSHIEVPLMLAARPTLIAEFKLRD